MFYTKLKNLDYLMENAFKDTFRDIPTWTTGMMAQFGYHSEKTDDGYKFELPVPGLSKGDIKVKIVKGKLEISNSCESNKWVPSFDRIFNLPGDVNTKEIKATIEHGVLTISIKVNVEDENLIEIS